MNPRLLVSESFPARLESATQARHFAEQTLTTWGCPELADTALLLVSELVVNAVSHASSTATVHLALADGVVRVEVDDSSAKIGNKIRLAAEQKVPLVLVVGSAEEARRVVSIRRRSGEQLGEVALDGLASFLAQELAPPA